MRPVKGGEQQDAFTPWRRYLFWQPGERRKIKRRAAKQARREARDEIKSRLRD